MQSGGRADILLHKRPGFFNNSVARGKKDGGRGEECYMIKGT